MELLRAKFLVIATLVYGLLIVLYFSVEPSENTDSCPFYMSCIRVCCQDEESCDEELIREAFMYNVTSDFDDNQTVPWEYHIAHGKPSCPFFASVEDYTSKEYGFDHRGRVELSEEGKSPVTFDHDEYCFEDINIAAHTWKFLACKKSGIDPEVIKYFSEFFSCPGNCNFKILIF
jgi:hypothetical protein